MKSKTVQTATKANKQTVKTPTINQIARGECCNASKELRAIIRETGLAPAEIAQHVQTMRESDESTQFQKWIESMPTLPDDPDGLVPMKVELNLHPRDWMIFTKLAKRQMEPIGFIMEDILADYACAHNNCGKFIRLKY